MLQIIRNGETFWRKIPEWIKVLTAIGVIGSFSFAVGYGTKRFMDTPKVAGENRILILRVDSLRAELGRVLEKDLVVIRNQIALQNQLFVSAICTDRYPTSTAKHNDCVTVFTIALTRAER